MTHRAAKSIQASAQARKCVAAIEKEKKILAAARDRLRELESEVADIACESDEAEQCLEQAVEALSKYL